MPLPLAKEQVSRLIGWLDAGYAGRMTWLHSNLEKRTDPAKLLPGAKSVIVVALNYKPQNSHPSSCSPLIRLPPLWAGLPPLPNMMTITRL